MSVDLLSASEDCSPAVPSCTFVPQLCEQQPAFAPHTLLHLKVGMLDVGAYQSIGHGVGFSTPMQQPITLPLSLHLHPELLTQEQRTGVPPAAPSSLSHFVPPFLCRLQSALLPTLLAHLPAMIAQVKLKKMDSSRGNRVGIVRTKQFVFTFTFRETQPSYHMLTVSSRRIRQMDAEANKRMGIDSVKAASFTHAASSTPATPALSSSSMPIPGASLSSSLSAFPIPTSSLSPVSLLRLSSLRGGVGTGAGAGAGVSESDEGFYGGGGFASYLVSKHALHVRMVPTRQAVEQMRREREEERERREEAERRDTRFEREEAQAQAQAQADDDAEAADAAAAQPRLAAAGSKRKTAPSDVSLASSSAGASKKARPIHSTLDAAVPAPPPPAQDELELEADGDDPDAFDEEWLNIEA